MFRMGMIVLLVCLALGAVGCASVQTGAKFNDMGLTTSNSTAVAHVNGSTWGIYFLPMFPMFTGDTATGSGITVGTDTCRIEPVVDMVTRKAKAMGSEKVVDMQSTRSSFWIPPFFWYKSVEVSGNAIK